MATNIEHIENGEQGLSVRQKINDLIDLAKTNQQSIIDLIAGGSGSKEKYCFKGIVSALDVPEQVTHDKEFYIGVFDWEEQTFENFLDPDGNKISVKRWCSAVIYVGQRIERLAMGETSIYTTKDFGIGK